jgi:hypothetical protein
MRGSSQPGANAVSAVGHDVHRLLAIKEYEKRKGRGDKGAPVGAASDPEPIEICNVMKFFHVDLYAAAVACLFCYNVSYGSLHTVRRSSTTWSTLSKWTSTAMASSPAQSFLKRFAGELQGRRIRTRSA